MKMNRDIICLSTHYWYDFWFRKQQFMSRLIGLGHRVLYVQPSFSMVRPNPKPELAYNRWLLPLTQKVSNELYLFSPPRLFPKPNVPLSSSLTYRWFAALISHSAKNIGMSRPVLWIYRPEFAVGLETIRHSMLVFDLADDLAAYQTRKKQFEYISHCTDTLARQADLMIVTSPSLKDKYQARAAHCVLIPNGFDEKLFDGRPKPIPADLAAIPGPIVGFVGVLFGFLDYELLFQTASRLPDISFVFIGPTEDGGRTGVARLQSLPNTHFLGRRPPHTIPDYVSNFDVCINPFKVDDVSKAVSPLKVYEYLACGKRVVSTPMDGLAREAAGKLVTFVDREGFSQCLQQLVISPESAEFVLECARVSRSFSWACQFEKLSVELES